MPLQLLPGASCGVHSDARASSQGLRDVIRGAAGPPRAKFGGDGGRGEPQLWAMPSRGLGSSGAGCLGFLPRMSVWPGPRVRSTTGGVGPVPAIPFETEPDQVATEER